MAFASIASHIINTFGEYPWLTLNAYNPWALVADSNPAAAMDQVLGWIHDAAFTVFEDGRCPAGFNVGPFSSDADGQAAPSCWSCSSPVAWWRPGFGLAAWTRAGPGSRGGGTRPRSLSKSDSDPAKPRGNRQAGFQCPTELRALAVGCLVAVGSLVFLLAGQPIGGLPAVVVGDGLLLAILVGVSVWAAWRDDRLSIVVALAILTIAFFVVPTRAHERYLFPFFAVGAILLAVSWRWSVRTWCSRWSTPRTCSPSWSNTRAFPAFKAPTGRPADLGAARRLGQLRQERRVAGGDHLADRAVGHRDGSGLPVGADADANPGRPGAGMGGG
jgi:hypothetical protein